MPRTALNKTALAALAALLTLGGLGAIALAAKMRSERIGPKLCTTTEGGRFVSIPGFAGERIDRRLLRDVRYLVRTHRIFITDGYSLDPVHSRKGEHPIGLALDIVPDRAAGGTWRDVSRLARWAEPKRDRPRPPFRWVGYAGDPGHGRGHHLHLSWAHSKARYGTPAKTVYTMRCPRPGAPPASKPPPPEPIEPSGDGKRRQDAGGRGGLAAGDGATSSNGGLAARRARRVVRRQQTSPRSRETGGIGAG